MVILKAFSKERAVPWLASALALSLLAGPVPRAHAQRQLDDCVVTVRLVSIDYRGADIGHQWVILFSTRGGAAQGFATMAPGVPAIAFFLFPRGEAEVVFTAPHQKGENVDVPIHVVAGELQSHGLGAAEVFQSFPCPGSASLDVDVLVVASPGIAQLTFHFEITLDP